MYLVFIVVFWPYMILEFFEPYMSLSQTAFIYSTRVTWIWNSLITASAVSIYLFFFVNRRRQKADKPALSSLTKFLIWLLLFDLLIACNFIFRPSEYPENNALFVIIALNMVSHLALALVAISKVAVFLMQRALRLLPLQKAQDWFLEQKKYSFRNTGILLSIPVLCLLSLAFWFATYGTFHPQASRFHVINAAIKNTCFMDPKQENCPQTKEEIAYIEPQQYQDMIDCCQVNYQYHPEINKYSLVVRYHPVRAVVFDWRLVDEIGIDFKEYKINLYGQDALIDPPPWDGPWEFDDWEY